MGVFVFLVLLALCIAFTFLGLKLCKTLADMFGIDPRNIPRRTYSPNGIYFGSILGFVVMLLSKNAIVGLLAGIVLSLLFFVIIFFIEVAITKATRPLTDKIEEKIDNAFSKRAANTTTTGEMSALDRIAREEEAKEQAARERKVLEEGGWRCAKCGKVNVSSIGFCSCGTSRGDSKKADEERKKKLEEMRTSGVVAVPENTANETVNETVKNSVSNTVKNPVNNPVPKPAEDYSEYDFSILDEEMDGNQWKCLKCQTLNPKLVSTCKCGYTYDQYSKTIALLKNKREEMLLAKKAEEETHKAELANQMAELDHQIIDILQNAGFDNPTISQKTVLKIVKQSKDGISATDIYHKLPRNADLKEYKKAVDDLITADILMSDESGRYAIHSNQTD
jgi:hypothetical protein